MKIGFIGAGKAGCSLGRYLSECPDMEVTGYYSLKKEDAEWAAAFTGTKVFDSIDAVTAENDSIILSTPDGAVSGVWESMNKERIKGRIFCHLSGSLSSDVFSGRDAYGAYAISIHPIFAFSNRESVYKQLHNTGFTLEGDAYAVSEWKQVFQCLGNTAIEIQKEVKPKYHAALSLLSNHVVAVLETGYELLAECGFSKEAARTVSAVLVKENVEHVIADGGVEALTGPIERADTETVRRHLQTMDEGQRRLYLACGEKLLQLAQQKHARRDYEMLELILETGDRK